MPKSSSAQAEKLHTHTLLCLTPPSIVNYKASYKRTIEAKRFHNKNVKKHKSPLLPAKGSLKGLSLATETLQAGQQISGQGMGL